MHLFAAATAAHNFHSLPDGAQFKLADGSDPCVYRKTGRTYEMVQNNGPHLRDLTMFTRLVLVGEPTASGRRE